MFTMQLYDNGILLSDEQLNGIVKRLDHLDVNVLDRNRDHWYFIEIRGVALTIDPPMPHLKIRTETYCVLSNSYSWVISV